MSSKPGTKPGKEQAASVHKRLSASVILLRLGPSSQVPGPDKTDQDLKHLQSRARSRWQSEQQVRTSGSVLPQGPGRIKTALVLTIISSFNVHAADV